MYDVDKWIALNPRFLLNSYNCFHFARDVWKDWTGLDIAFPVPGSAKGFRSACDDAARQLTHMDNPSSPCLAYFSKTSRVPHIGVYLNGHVLHLSANGAEFTPIRQMMQVYGGPEYYT